MNVKKLKIITFSAIIVTILYLNVSVDFSVLFDKDAQNGHFVRVGAEKVYAASKAIYNYSKYTTVKKYIDNAPWEYMGYSASYKGYYSYGFIPETGNYYTTIEFYDIYDQYYYHMDAGDGRQIYRYYTPSEYGNTQKWVKYHYNNSRVDAQGTYIGALTAVDSTYPDNGKHTDGYWYVKGSLVTNTPDISITSPLQNKTFSPKEGNNTMSLSGTIYDPDVGDDETIYYRIDGSEGQAGTQYGNKITSICSNQPFPSPAQSINVSGVAEGSRTLYAWVQDSKGGKSAEVPIAFTMDRTVPTVSAPTLIADSAYQITVQPNASDPTVAGVSSGFDKIPPFVYNRNGSDISTWQYENFPDIGLSPNTQYTYKYMARDNVLNTSGYSTIASKYTLAAAPLSLIVNNPTSQTLDVSILDENPPYTQYQIWTTTDSTRYATESGNLSPTAQWIPLTGKKITIKGLDPYKDYIFYAKAINADGIPNPTSVSKSGKTLSAPKPAASLAIPNIGNSFINVTWDPNGNSGSMVYNLVLQDPGNGVWFSNPETTSTSYSFSNLQPNTQYNVWVRVRNEISEWATQDYQLFGQPYTLANSPISPAWGSATQTTLNLNWGNNGNPTYTQYRVVLTDPSTGTWLFNSDWQTNVNSWTFTGLTPSTRYNGWVEARNVSGTESSWINFGTKTTLANTPGTGTIGTVTNNSISASWQANGNSMGTQYSLAAFSTSGILVKQNTWTTSLSDTMTSLSANTPYKIMVKARNGDNIETGWLTISSGTATNPNIPLPPIGLTATVSTRSSITLTWKPSVDASSYDILKNGITIYNVTSPFKDEGLSSETTYTYQVRAKNITGSSGYCTSVSAITLPDPPGVPVLSTSSSTTAITLTWNKVVNATGYKVEVDKGEQIIDVRDAASFIHDNLGKGSRHYYRVLAYNAGGDGNYTQQYTLSTLLDTPSDITASSSNNRLLVAWCAVENATKYEVNIGGNVYTTTGTSISGGNLNASTTYTYKVRALNNVSSSLWSDERTKTTLCNPPDVPGNISSIASRTTVTLAWDAVAGAAGYDVMADGQLFTVVKGTSFVHTGLTPGKEYSLKVRARNAGGKSAWSGELKVSTLPSSPNVPSNLHAIPATTSVGVRWDPVLNADNYEVEVDSINFAAVSVPEYVFQTTTSASYTFRVRAVVKQTPGDWSEVLTTALRSNDFGIPGNLKAIPSTTSVALTWVTVEHATGYDIEVNGEVVDSVKGSIYTQAELQPETMYIYRVRAQVQEEKGDWSEAISCVTLPQMPEIPKNIKANAYSNKIRLSWNPVIDASSYDISIDNSSIKNTVDCSYLDEGLNPSAPHTYRIRSVNDNGYGDWSEIITVSTLSDKPAVPDNIILLPTNKTIKIVWDKVEGADSYNIEIDKMSTENIIDTQYLHTNLSAGASHTYRIRALYGTIAGDWSEYRTKSTLPSLPSVPGNVAITTSSSGIAVTYGAVDNAEGYDIYLDGSTIDNGASTTFTKTGLNAGTQHSIRARARNASGVGDWSNEMTVLTLAEVPGVPGGIRASSTISTIAISWNELPGTLEYEVDTGSNIVNVGLNTQYIDSGLASGALHTYRIRSVNAGGHGNWSSFVETGTKLAIPEGLSAVPGENTILLKWNAVNGAVGYDIEIDGAKVTSASALSFTHEGLLPNREYTYRVRAKNAVNTGDWSSPLISGLPTQIYTDTFKAEEELYFEVDANNVSDIGNARFTLKFDPTCLDIVDLCAETEKIDLETGDVEDSNIRVVQLSQGKIVLAVSGNESPGEYSGLVDIVLFKAKTAGEASITYSMETNTSTVGGQESSSLSSSYLADIALSSGTLSPVFGSYTFNYSTSVEYSTTSMTVTPTAEDPAATIKVNGTIVPNGTASSPINLSIGNNTISVEVSKPGVPSKTYVIHVDRQHSNYLANIALSAGSLTPKFTSTSCVYTTSVDYDTSSITVTPMAVDSAATITVNGMVVTSGQSALIALSAGSNMITIAVSVPGMLPRTYTIRVERQHSSYLSNITLSAGTLSPNFSMTTSAYTASVENDTSSITVTPTAEDPAATITVNGTAVASGTASTPVALSAGNNTITVVVSAPGVPDKSYVIWVVRHSNYLTNVIIKLGKPALALSPPFSKSTTSYTVSLTQATSSLSVKATAEDPTATIKISGSPAASGLALIVPVTPGTVNKITIEVTTPGGSKIYEFYITVPG
jgi:hypothetical protein